MHTNSDLKKFVMDLLKGKLPEKYYYHNLEHTKYTMEKAIEIGRHEHCSEKEIDLLWVAALWHDIGFINTYAGHEEEGCKLAWQYLPGYGFSTSDINTICGMVMATKIPQSPQHKLEEILADADLEYFGADNPESKAALLFSELQTLDPSLTNEAWDQIQISFLQHHHYFTNYCQKNKEPAKQDYLNKLLAESGTEG